MASVATCDSRTAAQMASPAASAPEAPVSSSVQHPQMTGPLRNGAYPGAMYSGPTVTTGSEPWWQHQQPRPAGGPGITGQQQWAGTNAHAVHAAPLPHSQPAPAAYGNHAAASRHQSAALAGRHPPSGQHQHSGPAPDSVRRPSQSMVAEMLGRHLGADYFDDALMDLVAEVDSMVSGDEASSVASEAPSACLPPGSTAGTASQRYAMPLQPMAPQPLQNRLRGNMPMPSQNGHHVQHPLKATPARLPARAQPQEQGSLQQRPVVANTNAYQAASHVTASQVQLVQRVFKQHGVGVKLVSTTR